MVLSMSNGFRLVSTSVPKVTEKVFSRKQIMLGRLLTQWPEIVGKDMALKTAPGKIRRMKSRKTGKMQASLDISASTADATLMHYRKDLILQRLNLIFGDDTISAIRFVPKATNDTNEHVKKRKKALSLGEKEMLSHMLSSVEDTDLLQKLQSLGEAILQDRKP